MKPYFLKKSTFILLSNLKISDEKKLKKIKIPKIAKFLFKIIIFKYKKHQKI